MPTYEYECPEGHTFEKFQKITDKPLAKCPACGKASTRKISGGAGFVFRGSGFYITDYGKDGKGPLKPEAEKPVKTSESSPGEGAGGSKAKPESSPSKPTGKDGGKAAKE